MRVLIDTNVLIDYIAMREPHYASARRIIAACDRRLMSGCIAAHSIPDVYYILRKTVPAADRRKVLKFLCEIFTVENLDKYKLIDALENEDFTDFEDCLQMQCAIAFYADYIITRNEKDFMGSNIPPILPEVFCQRFLERT